MGCNGHDHVRDTHPAHALNPDEFPFQEQEKGQEQQYRQQYHPGVLKILTVYLNVFPIGKNEYQRETAGKNKGEPDTAGSE